jgi:hypothetical protein
MPKEAVRERLRKRSIGDKDEARMRDTRRNSTDIVATKVRKKQIKEDENKR